MLKLSYENSTKKREVQEYIFSRVRNRVIAGLPGPDIKTYLEILGRHKFNKALLYENSPRILAHQIQQRPNCPLVFGNILEHLKKGPFYDLDFCCSIKSILLYLKKIVELESYALTLSLRPIGEEKTCAIFKEYMKDGQEIPYFIYKDTTPMITFYSL